MSAVFDDRRDAGRQLADRLSNLAGTPDLLVLALPRGGVPVAFEVARGLDAELDVLVVRKIGVRSQPELAMGAIAAGGREVLDPLLIEQLGLSHAQVQAVVRTERAELARRERAYRANRPAPLVRGRTVIVVDDGLATGASMHAALEVLRAQAPTRLIVAVPVAPHDTISRLRGLADDIVCITAPRRFGAVGAHYRDFSQTEDAEVRALLAEAHTRAHPKPQPAAGPHTALARVRAAALRLEGGPSDYDALIEHVGDRSLVLLGEASHGTREFYRMRAEITQRLIDECGFEAVAAEADWPDAYSLNRYVRAAEGTDPERAFDVFERFPEWMWRNHEVRDFVAWLAGFNADRAPTSRVGFYGLDLYSLYRSADEVIAYLKTVDPTQAEIARRRYACLDHVRDPQQYGYEAAFHLRPDCLEAVTRELADLRGRRGAMADAGAGPAAADERFFAERNAVVVRNAEAYYRAMFGSRVNTWNLRDDHMADTLFALQAHLRAQGGRGRVVVWAHNSHLGDARATAMGQAGEWNLGQRVRERVGHAGALLVGFTTYTGYVSAAHEWGGHVERMRVRPALPESVEHLFYRTRHERFCLPLAGPAADALRPALLERAIGVLYRPDTERVSHYFDAAVADQFDMVFHLDETDAVAPLYAARH